MLIQGLSSSFSYWKAATSALWIGTAVREYFRNMGRLKSVLRSFAVVSWERLAAAGCHQPVGEPGLKCLCVTVRRWMAWSTSWPCVTVNCACTNKIWIQASLTGTSYSSCIWDIQRKKITQVALYRNCLLADNLIEKSKLEHRRVYRVGTLILRFWVH